MHLLSVEGGGREVEGHRHQHLRHAVSARRTSMIRIWLWQLPLPPELQFLANPWGSALATLLFWLLVAFVLQFLVLRLIKALARRTESEIEDVIIDVSRRPIVLLVIILGLISSLDSLRVADASLEKVQRWLTAAAVAEIGRAHI